MKGLQLSLPEVVDACCILFGPEAPVTAQFISTLDIGAVRSAYRRRAFETHPDRTVHVGNKKDAMEERFKDLVQAYETILLYARQQACFGKLSSPVVRKREARQAIYENKKGSRAFRRSHAEFPGHARELPERRLYLGQYLYHSKVISRGTLGAALSWQKMKRPVLGRIAREWNWLTRDEVQEILQLARVKEKFGEAAERIGFLKHHQTIILLGRQRILQPRIGEYFIGRGILDSSFLARAEYELRLHNKNCPMGC